MDTGSELTWLPAEVVKGAGITPQRSEYASLIQTRPVCFPRVVVQITRSSQRNRAPAIGHKREEKRAAGSQDTAIVRHVRPMARVC